MIFVDTNVFVSAFGRRAIDRDMFEERSARDLLGRLALGLTSASTSEAILVEATQILTSDRLNGWSVPDVAAFLADAVKAPGLRIAPKIIYLRALDVWTSRPGLGFVDCLTLAYVEQDDVELASFDRQLLRSPGVTPYWREPDATL